MAELSQEGRDGLLVGGTEDEFSVVAIVEDHELLSHGVEPLGLAPKFGWSQNRQLNLLTSITAQVLVNQLDQFLNGSLTHKIGNHSNYHLRIC